MENEPVNQIDVNAVNRRTKASELFGKPSPAVAEALASTEPLGYAEGKRLREQMGDDLITYLTAELGMFMAREGIDGASAQGQLLTNYIGYVVTQWQGLQD